MPESHFTSGLTQNLRAPYSGVLDEKSITQSLATLPEAILELQRKWSEVGPARNSGLALAVNGNPFDDAMRDGVWRQDLQHNMPIAGGLPGSGGKPQAWTHAVVEPWETLNFDNKTPYIFQNTISNMTVVSNIGGEEKFLSGDLKVVGTELFSTRNTMMTFERWKIAPDISWRSEETIGHLTGNPNEKKRKQISMTMQLTRISSRWAC